MNDGRTFDATPPGTKVNTLDGGEDHGSLDDEMQPARSRTHVDDSGPRSVVSGTDIKVSQVASEYEHLGMTPDDIVDAHPHLSLADVHAALAYYYDHRDAIRREWLDAESFISALRIRFPSRISRSSVSDQ